MKTDLLHLGIASQQVTGKYFLFYLFFILNILFIIVLVLKFVNRPHEYQPRGNACSVQPEFFLNNHQKALLVGNDKAVVLGTGPLSSKNVPLV